MLEVSGLKKATRGNRFRYRYSRFGRLFLATSPPLTGWTMREIEQLTLWELNDLMAYWKDYPPTHVLVAALPEWAAREKGPARIGARLPDTLMNSRRPCLFAGGSVSKKLPQIYKT